MAMSEKKESRDWYKEAVFYQIWVRSFCDGNGDGIGDLAGITGKLDYLRDLGVDAVWISPFFKSPQDDCGYDISDFCDVDGQYGTLADFDALLAAAHERGIRVLLDLVVNHTSTQHPWFRAAVADPFFQRLIIRADASDHAFRASQPHHLI